MKRHLPSSRISARKARRILDEGEARGYPLTGPQRRMFAAAAFRDNPSLAVQLRELQEAVNAEYLRWKETAGRHAYGDDPYSYLWNQLGKLSYYAEKHGL